ncbi:MAG: hypothetical protein WCC47_24905 [Pseudonocardiaceae bacterium]
MMYQFLFDAACILFLGVLVGIEEWTRRRRAAASEWQLLQRRRDIERATRAATQRIHAHYQAAARAAVQHMVQQSRWSK